MITIKRLLKGVLVASLFSASLMAQSPQRLRITSKESGQAIDGVVFAIHGTKTPKEIKLGKRNIVNLGKLPKGRYTLTIRAVGYIAKQLEIVVEADGTIKNLKDIQLEALPTLAEVQDNFSSERMQGFDVMEEGQDEFDAIQQSSLLHSSRSPFLAAASYVFSAARFNRRGYDSPYRVMYLNGVPMNDVNTGYGVWSLWGGLNDVTRYRTSGLSMEPIEEGFGSIGMSENLSIRASKMRAETKLTYSSSNRSYTDRFMATWASGQLANGWSFGVSLSKRNGDGQRSFVKGVHYDSYAYLLAVEKQLNKQNSLSLVAFASPTRRGVASGSTQEAYDLVHSNYYNPNLGLQGGKWRNAREKNMHEPVIQLTHYFETLDKSFKLNTTLGTRFGKNTYSALNWYNAPDPRPDYYRYLPSYFTDLAYAGSEDPTTANIYKEMWLNDASMHRVNWDRFYQVNSLSDAPLYDAQGNLLQEGKQAQYMIELRHTDQMEFSGASNFSWNPSKWFSLDGGVNARYNRTSYFNEVGDLLGADYVYDIDKFAVRDFGGDSDKYQMDIRRPDHIARKGDKMGHDYQAVTAREQGWFNSKFKFANIDAYLGASIAHAMVYRLGKQQRGLFPDNSLGRSRVLNFLDYGAKAGLTYKINGRHYVILNGSFVKQAPVFRNIFISPRTRNDVVNNVKSEKLLSVDLAYAVRLPWLRGSVTLFASNIRDKSRTLSFYDDTNAAFSNYTLTGINTTQFGVEAGFEAKILPTLSLNVAGAWGKYFYSNNPDFVQTIDNSAKILAEEKVYWNGLSLDRTPQLAGTIGMTYRAPWYGMLGFNANYFGFNHISMNPTLRTDAARAVLDSKYIKPERLKGGFTLDLFVGYSYRITHGKYIRFNLSVNNLLNNRSIHSGGYEQLRVRTERDAQGVPHIKKPFPSKYFYSYGTTYFFNTSIQF